MIKKKHLTGVEVPSWYFDRERELLEALLRLEEAKNEYRQARSRLYSMMNENGVQRIDIGLLTVTTCAPSTHHRIDARILKERYPDIWRECVTEHQQGGRLVVRMK